MGGVYMSAPINVAIIDDDERMLRALARLVKSVGMQAATFATAHEFLDAPIREDMDCVLTDMRMPGLDGLRFQEKLQQVLPDLSVVFLTGHGKVSTSVRAMKAGAVDFLEKPVEDESLLAAIARAADRTRQSRQARVELKGLQERFRHLTPREREVFGLITAGFLNKQVGAELGIAEKTIKVHRARVLEKMKAKSLADLVRMAGRLDVG
ncbi:MAG: response regulator transcription factor [Deltaproteobacteria bacterium]|nr:response regulator transcription factor [Deltaproteobacteria bacterium]